MTPENGNRRDKKRKENEVPPPHRRYFPSSSSSFSFLSSLLRAPSSLSSRLHRSIPGRKFLSRPDNITKQYNN